MAKKKQKEQLPQTEKELRNTLPPGVKLLRTLEGHKDAVRSVTFDPQGGMLASVSFDQTVKLWDTRSGKLLRTLEGHEHWMVSVAYDPQGGTLASGGGDTTVKLWEARNGELLHTVKGHKGSVWRNPSLFRRSCAAEFTATSVMNPLTSSPPSI